MFKQIIETEEDLEEVFIQIKENIYDEYDDPEDEDESDLNEEAKDIFYDIYGFEYDEIILIQ